MGLGPITQGNRENMPEEDVAETLVDIHSYTGIPEEMLIDIETQFTSDCMKEVLRLLSLKQLIYHHIIPSISMVSMKDLMTFCRL